MKGGEAARGKAAGMGGEDDGNEVGDPEGAQEKRESLHDTEREGPDAEGLGSHHRSRETARWRGQHLHTVQKRTERTLDEGGRVDGSVEKEGKRRQKSSMWEHPAGYSIFLFPGTASSSSSHFSAPHIRTTLVYLLKKREGHAARKTRAPVLSKGRENRFPWASASCFFLSTLLKETMLPGRHYPPLPPPILRTELQILLSSWKSLHRHAHLRENRIFLSIFIVLVPTKS